MTTRAVITGGAVLFVLLANASAVLARPDGVGPDSVQAPARPGGTPPLSGAASASAEVVS